MTIEEVFQEAAKRGLPAKRWSGSRLLTYNGFTHEQRVRKWQALDLAIRLGLEIPADQLACSVCGAEPSSAIAYHSEDYGSMHGHYPVCRSCHAKIHNCSRYPERWRQLLSSFGNGRKWFEKIHATDVTTLTGLETSFESTASCIHKGTGEKAMDFVSGKSIPSPRNVIQEMHSIRIAFVKSMGIRSQTMNPNPVGGYKLEHNSALRSANLVEARRLRNIYAEMVEKYGKGHDVLYKLDSNIANRDRGAVR